MAGGRTFKVIFDGDSSGAEAASGRVVKSFAEVDEHSSKLGSSLGKVSQIAGGFILGQGILKAPGFLMDAAKAAAEDEASTARLNQTLQNYVESTGDAAATGEENADWLRRLKGHTDELIKSGQKLAFSDDEIRDSFGSLLTATGDVDEATLRLGAAQDLARAKQIPLAEASKLLGKVTDDNLQVLKRMGITLPDVANQADVLAAVQKKFAGQADTYAKSTAGQFAQAQIAMDEIKESIGAALLPVITKLTGVLAEQLPVIQALAGEYSAKAAPAIAAVVAVLGPLIEKIGGSKTLLAAAAIVIGGVVVAAFTAWAISAASAAVATIAAAAPVLAVVAALALLTLAIYLIIDNWDEIVERYPAVGRAFDDIKAAIQAVVDYVVDNWDTIRATIEPALVALVAMVKYQWEQIKVGIDAALKIIGGYLDIWIGLFTGDWDRVWEGVKGVLSGALDAITSSIGNAFDLVNELTGGKLGEFTSTVSGALSDAAGAVRSFYDDAVQPIQWLIDRFWDLIHVIQSIPTPHIGNPMNLIPGRAEGGPVSAGSLYMVGERGPEFFIPDVPGRIASHGESRQMAGAASGGGGRGGLTVIINGDWHASDDARGRITRGDISYFLDKSLRGIGAG